MKKDTVYFADDFIQSQKYWDIAANKRPIMYIYVEL